MEYETIVTDFRDGVTTITLNRPDQYNALTTKMYKELGHAFKGIGRDLETRAVILTGKGKGFCSGQDLVEMQQLMGAFSVGDVLRTGLNPLIQSIRTLEKPVICALNGAAAGAGGSLALACDYRIASARASFVFAAFVNIGIIPDGGGTYLLSQLVGVAKAFELVLTADSRNRVDAESALNLGIVNRVAPHEELEREAWALASQLAKMPTKAIGMTKRAMYRAAEHGLVDAMEYEAQVQEGAFRTHDFREGVQAFIEKRAPVFKGE